MTHFADPEQYLEHNFQDHQVHYTTKGTSQFLSFVLYLSDVIFVHAVTHIGRKAVGLGGNTPLEFLYLFILHVKNKTPKTQT